MMRTDEVLALEPEAKAHPLYGANLDELVCPLTGIRYNDRITDSGHGPVRWDRKFPTSWIWHTITTRGHVTSTGYRPAAWEWLTMKVPSHVAEMVSDLLREAQRGTNVTHCCFCQNPVDYDRPGDLTTLPRDDEVICHQGCLVDHEYDRYVDYQISQAEGTFDEGPLYRTPSNPNMGGI